MPWPPPVAQAQDDALPVVTLGSVTPSPVRPGQSLRITVHINPPLPADATEDDRITGGIQAFDSWKGSNADAWVKFVFRAGQTTRTMSYRVDDSVEPGPSARTIRIAVNPVFDEYRVGSPSEVTINVRDEPAPEPDPEPTEEPTPEPTEEPTPEPTEEPTPVPTAAPTPVPTRAPTPVPAPTPEEHLKAATIQQREPDSGGTR